MPGSTAFIIGTFDTKAEELIFVRDRIRNNGVKAVTVDLGTSSAEVASLADISSREVAAQHPGGTAAVFTGDRGSAVAAMAEAFTYFLSAQKNIAGVIGLGGSGGTAVIGPAFQQLPIGIPKVIVSTMASGNVAPYIGASDICMMYAVTDISGLNPILEQVLSNAAHALLGMMRNPHQPVESGAPMVGMTMFGVTTPCVESVKKLLEPEMDSLIFHATGTGGKAMEKLVGGDLLSGVIDVTTTEVADHLMGGILSAGEGRLDAFIHNSLPYVGSCGAVDMVNFGARDTVPDRYADRLFYEHNPHITLMRTTPEENSRMGHWIGGKINRFRGPSHFLIPTGGFSALNAPDQPFYDPEADAAFIDALESHVTSNPDIKLTCLPYHINDPAFATALADSYFALTGETKNDAKISKN